MNLSVISDDLLVIDYTDYHEQNPAVQIPTNGVFFTVEPDERIGAFCILNPRHISFDAINLEENPALVTDEGGHAAKQCECICRAHREEGRRWVLLVELKYCTEDNIPDNMQNAFDKLDQCYDFLREKKHFFDDAQYKVYLCPSHPEHETMKPFGEFIFNQDRLLSLKSKGADLLYANAVEILTPEYLRKAPSIPRRYQFMRG